MKSSRVLASSNEKERERESKINTKHSSRNLIIPLDIQAKKNSFRMHRPSSVKSRSYRSRWTGVEVEQVAQWPRGKEEFSCGTSHRVGRFVPFLDWHDAFQTSSVVLCKVIASLGIKPCRRRARPCIWSFPC